MTDNPNKTAARPQGQYRAAIQHLERVLAISKEMAEFTGDADAVRGWVFQRRTRVRGSSGRALAISKEMAEFTGGADAACEGSLMLQGMGAQVYETRGRRCVLCSLTQCPDFTRNPPHQYIHSTASLLIATRSWATLSWRR